MDSDADSPMNPANDSAPEYSDDDGKVICTCGCRKRLSVRQKNRHLETFRKCRDRAAASKSNGAINLDDHRLIQMENSSNENLLGVQDQSLDMERTADNMFDQDRDMFVQNELDDDMSDALSSNGSWYNVGTPPPTPPPLPSENSDDDIPSDDEDDYQNITFQDYREYDRWFAEDRQDELDEMVAETLTEEELDSIKMMAIRQFGHISIRNYERIRYSFRGKIRLLTLQRLGTRIAALSGITPINIECCVGICHAFNQQYADETHCSACREPRYDSNGRPRKIYQYIPIIPRLQALFNNPVLVEKILYRHNYQQEAGVLDDFFDSAMYKELCGRNIIVDGEDVGAKFFSGIYDIATSIMSDGVQIFQNSHRESSTCWPILMQILNLPPVDRIQLRNVMPIAVIPGPNQPRDFDSFLVPFVAECKKLARGVETFDVRTGRTFLLRQHPVIVGGDMQAVKHFEQLKGPNAIVPCRGCLSEGVYHRDKRTYYIPLAQPIDPDDPTTPVQSYDPLNLPLRTDKNLIAQLKRMESANTNAEYQRRAQKYGISGPSILDQIPSIQRPSSYPHEFLHLFLLNHGPGLISLWTGTHPGISNSGREGYLLSKGDWITIGEETEHATNLIPSAFIRPLPNIQSSTHLFCGESWSFWLVYIGPIVLRGRLKQKYYDHYLELVCILKCLLEFDNTTNRIEQLRYDIAGYVERFEEYYYQYDYDRLCVCRLTLHALLHVADDVLRCGPMWVYWSFGTERYCREVVACAKSKVVPYSSINKYILQMAQLASVSARFPDIRKALLFGKAEVPVETNRMELTYDEYPHAILRVPRLRGFLLQAQVRRRLAGYFRTNDARRTFHQWMQFIPERCERWGKLRIGGGGDCIRAASATNPLSAYGKRDTSFVRFKFYRDKNERHRNKPVEMIPVIGYGRLDYILVVSLPPDPDFGVDQSQLHILAHLTEAKDAEGDASVKPISYTTLGRSFILDITAVEHVVGRVQTRGSKASGEWFIVDRSNSLCATVFHQPEGDFEEDEADAGH